MWFSLDNCDEPGTLCKCKYKWYLRVSVVYGVSCILPLLRTAKTIVIVFCSVMCAAATRAAHKTDSACVCLYHSDDGPCSKDVRTISKWLLPIVLSSHSVITSRNHRIKLSALKPRPYCMRQCYHCQCVSRDRWGTGSRVMQCESNMACVVSGPCAARPA